MPYQQMIEDDDIPDFHTLHGDWRPATGATGAAGTYKMHSTEVPSREQQIRDLGELLGSMAHVYDKKPHLGVFYYGENVYHFRIEMTKPIPGVDPLGGEATHENNVYREDVPHTDPPIYTELVRGEEGRILGNFWNSFVEHGLPHLE